MLYLSFLCSSRRPGDSTSLEHLWIQRNRASRTEGVSWIAWQAMFSDRSAFVLGALTFMYLSALRKHGERKVGAPIACIGSGTGLGQTFLTCPTQGEQAHLEVPSGALG